MESDFLHFLYAYGVYNLVSAFIFLIVFIKLFRLMKRYHRLEFESNQTQMSFFCAFIILGYQLQYQTYLVSYFVKANECSDMVIKYSLYSYNPQNIFIAWVIISIKSDQDLLQGVSKLDSLLKISIFQKFKLDDHIKSLE